MNISQITEDSRFRLLKTELEISRDAIFLAIYRDEGIKAAVIGELKKAVPSCEHLFPAENISAVIAQYRPEQPTIFWISPEDEKEVFSSFSEVYHGKVSVYDFSGISEEIRQSRRGTLISEGLPAAVIEKFSKYLEKSVRQYEQTEPYYIPPYFTNRKKKTFALDDLVRVFLADTGSTNLLLILGNSNSGKTCFLSHCFAGLSRQFLNNPDKERIPVFISLAAYSEIPDIEKIILKEFQTIYDVEISGDAFRESCRKGKFAFLLDGFDRMTAGMAIGEISDIMKSVYRLSFEEDGGKSLLNKVIMSCKPHYVFNDIEGERPASEEYTPLYREYAPKRNVEAVCINPKVLDEAQLKEYVVKTIKDSIAARNILSLLHDDHLLKEISDPSLFQDMVIQTLPLFREKKEINAADIYRVYTDIWINCEDFRSRLSAEKKKLLIWEAARNQIPAENEDLRFCSFLRCDEKGKYTFTHNSFLSYFQAQQYFDRIKNKQERLFPATDLDNETVFFLKLIISSEKADLKGLDLSELNLENANLYKAELSGANLNKTNLKSAELMGAGLQDTDLTGANLTKTRLTRANFHNADLTGTDLSKARLRDADLRTARLNGANFHSADMTGAKLTGAKLTFTGLGEADLTRADLSGTVLTNADLMGAKLCQTNLNKADLTGVNLSEADLTDADLVEAILSEADLRKAKLIMTNLTWAKLNEADLSEADMSRCRLREADLTECNFHQTCLNQADLRWAKIDRARFRGAKLREAHFTGASMVETILNEADLSWANMSSAILKKADLTGAVLNMAKLNEADLSGAKLVGADLTWTDLSKANLSDADLSSANLSESDLSEANLTGAKLGKANLIGAKLQNTKFDGADIVGAVFKEKKS
jgi:uncharacterized protein YjbI with pentapeptide repeats